MRAIHITEFGGPEVLTEVEVDPPTANPGEVLITVDRAGINYADTHQAENSYLAPTKLPTVVGGEVVGRTPEDRRVVALVAGGGYAEIAAAPLAMCFDVPDGVTDTEALALVVQGSTAWLLLRKTAHLAPGESVVVHAGAGGVGSIAIQLAKLWDAGNVIASASTEEKRELVQQLGADQAIDSTAPDMTAAIRAANDGRRVDVILDMTGGSVTDQSLKALAPFGRLAFYGQASREPATPIPPASLLAHSTTIGGMWLPHAFGLPGFSMADVMAQLFELVIAKQLRVLDGGVYPLGQARIAHEDLRARRTTGKLTLDPKA